MERRDVAQIVSQSPCNRRIRGRNETDRNSENDRRKVGDGESHHKEKGRCLEEDAEGVQRKMIIVKAIVVLGVVFAATVFYAAVLAVASEDVEYEE